MIFEPEDSQPGHVRLADILSRDSVRDGGPLLPGLDAQKRQAQLRAEARRSKRESTQVRAKVRAPSMMPRPAIEASLASARHLAEGTGTSVLPSEVNITSLRPQAPARHGTSLEDLRVPVARSIRALRYGLLCASALAAGFLVAVLQSAL